MAIMNNAAMDLGVQNVRFMFSWKLLVHMLTLCVILRETDKLFSKQLHHFVYPGVVYEDSNFLRSHQHFILYAIFKKLLPFSMCVWCLSVVSLCICPFLFVCSLVICVLSLEKCLIRSFVHFYIG